MSAERHLLKEALVHVPLLGITLVYVCWNNFCFDKNYSSRTIYLVFADLAFSGVKSLFRNIFYFLNKQNMNYLQFFYILCAKRKKKTNKQTIRCYTVCTHNRIRSPRLAAFGRIETRWVREVGKFGPYSRYKDWLRRRLLVQLLFNIFVLFIFYFGKIK